MRGVRGLLVGALVLGAWGCSCSDDPAASGFDNCGEAGCGEAGVCKTEIDCSPSETCTNGRCMELTSCKGDNECIKGKRCSAAEVCIDEGTCLLDDDCSMETFCSTTRACITDGTCAADGDCEKGKICTEQNACIPGSDCGAEVLEADVIPNNFLFVLDRSCSMNSLAGSKKKWDSAVDAIVSLTTKYNGAMRFGLTMFPDTLGDKCDQTEFPVPVGDGNEAAIQTLLTGAKTNGSKYYPDGPCSTPIYNGLQLATTEPAFNDVDRKSYLVLISDGKQTKCNNTPVNTLNTQTVALIADLYTNRQVASFVVGFGAGINPGTLESFSNVGGVPRPGSPTYYQADNAAEFEAQLANILGQVASCDFQLGQEPENLDDLYVFFNDVDQIEQDITNGWEYIEDGNRLEFHGEACTRIKAGQVNDLDVVFGCPVPVIQ